jgi:hypothetical protein
MPITVLVNCVPSHLNLGSNLMAIKLLNEFYDYAKDALD